MNIKMYKIIIQLHVLTLTKIKNILNFVHLEIRLIVYK